MIDKKIAWRIWAGRTGRIVIGVAILAGLAYWFLWAPVPVVEHRIGRGLIVAEVMGTGTLEARVKTTISPKISGRISEVYVDQGDRVTAGQLLVRLDDVELAQQVEIARANKEAGEAAIDRLKIDKNRTTAILDQAQKHYERTAELRQSNNVSAQELDKAREGLGIAQAGLSNSEASVSEAQKELVAAEKTLQYHQARQLDTQITAPFEGLIVARSREPGDVVVPGSAILMLISTDELWIRAWVDETEMAKLEPEQEARVVFRSEPDTSYPAHVARLGREADRETREFIVDVSVEELPDNWAVGQRADVFIENDRDNSALLLPPAFVVIRDTHESNGNTKKTSGVFLNDGGKARWMPVKFGLRSREILQITEGPAEGETVINPVGAKGILTDGKRIIAQ